MFDGAAVINMLRPSTAKTFNEYASKVFLPYIKQQLCSVIRIDIVWDTYKIYILKASTRAKRGPGLRQKVVGSSMLPKNLQMFLQIDENKVELFDFLTLKISEIVIEGKEIYSTYGMKVLSSPENL